MTDDFLIEGTYDKRNDVLYLEASGDYADTVALSDDLIIDVNSDDNIIGVEIHYASEAFNIPAEYLDDLVAVKGHIDVSDDEVRLHLKVVSDVRNDIRSRGSYNVHVPNNRLKAQKQPLATA